MLQELKKLTNNSYYIAFALIIGGLVIGYALYPPFTPIYFVAGLALAGIQIIKIVYIKRGIPK